VALADGTESALARHPELIGGFNVIDGNVVHASVAGAIGLTHTDVTEVLGSTA
jgi:alanine dehydrogenase